VCKAAGLRIVVVAVLAAAARERRALWPFCEGRDDTRGRNPSECGALTPKMAVFERRSAAKGRARFLPDFAETAKKQ
jgi:hypothetical protein